MPHPLCHPHPETFTTHLVSQALAPSPPASQTWIARTIASGDWPQGESSDDRRLLKDASACAARVAQARSRRTGIHLDRRIISEPFEERGTRESCIPGARRTAAPAGRTVASVQHATGDRSGT